MAAEVAHRYGVPFIDEARLHQMQLDTVRTTYVFDVRLPEDFAAGAVMPAFAALARSQPQLRLELTSGLSQAIWQQFQSGELDLAISNREDEGFEGFALRSTPTVWLCGAGYAHDPGKPVPLVMADGPSIFRRLGCDALDAAGIAWTPRHTCTSLVGIRAALRAGLGVTARGVEQLDPGLRVLGAGDGMPPLPDLEPPVQQLVADLIVLCAACEPQGILDCLALAIRARADTR
jgi:DNA-binding transcriptional LysR family regulator